MEAERKTESVSAEDLKRIIKKMIRKALNDNEHMVKLHKKICEEWYNVLGQKNSENFENPNEEQKIQKKSKRAIINNEFPKKTLKNIQKVEKKGKFLEESKKNENFVTKYEKIEEKIQKPPISEESLRKILNDEQDNALGRKQRAWEFYHHQKRLQKGWKMRKSLEFNSWLNQLDSVLHQKYLREHRHQVQSFYCQPTYYGNEIPEALFRNYCMQYGINQ